MDEACCNVHRANLAPGFRCARIEQGVGKHMTINEKTCDVRIDPTGLLNETFNIPACIQPEAQPVLQDQLGMNSLLECSV